MKCQKNRACVKQPANALPDFRKKCTGCEKIGKDRIETMKKNQEYKWRLTLFFVNEGREYLFINCPTVLESRRTVDGYESEEGRSFHFFTDDHKKIIFRGDYLIEPI